MRKYLLLTISLIICSNFNTNAQWQKLPGLTKNVISVCQSNNHLIAGTESGVYYSSNNGNTWSASTGITSSAYSFTKSGNSVLVGSYGKVYKSNNDGASWSILSIIDYGAINKILVSDINYVAGMNGNGIFFSNDNGVNWWQSSSSCQSSNTDIVEMKNLLFASFYFGGYLQGSSDHGQSWFTPSGNGIKIGLSSSFQEIYSLAVKNDSVIIAGTNNGGSFSSYDGVYFSYNNGDDWTKRVNGITTTAINNIAVIGNLIFVGTNGGGIFYSTNNGNNWLALNDGLSNLTINKLYINGSSLYAGVSTGLFTIDICNLLKKTSTLKTFGSTNVNSGDSVKLLANQNGNNYKWLLNDEIIFQSNKNIFYAKSSGNYKAVIMYSSSCSDTTNTVSVTVNNTSEISKRIISNNLIKIYPNPSSEIISVSLDNTLLNSTYCIIDQQGRTIITGIFTKENSDINIKELYKGLYFLYVGKQDNLVFKLMKK